MNTRRLWKRVGKNLKKYGTETFRICQEMETQRMSVNCGNCTCISPLALAIWTLNPELEFYIDAH